MWWKHVLAFLLGALTAVVCIVLGVWAYVELS